MPPPTTKIYARVGGVIMKVLAILELEFLSKMAWRIVLKAELLHDYYRSLTEGNPYLELDSQSNDTKYHQGWMLMMRPQNLNALYSRARRLYCMRRLHLDFGRHFLCI